MRLTLDSSVFVASIIEQEKHHNACRNITERVAKSEHIAVVPYSVLVETVASLRRRTGSETIAENSGKELQNIDSIIFLELTKERALEAADIAKETSIRGMDAIVVQVARENDAILITLDNDMLKRSKKVAKAMDIEMFSKIDSQMQEDDKEEKSD